MTQLTERDLTVEQQDTIDRLYNHNHTLVVAPMGGGKTVCTLTAAKELLDAGELNRVLVVAPLKVCNQVWACESDKWAHLAGLDVAVVTGAASERLAALRRRARVVVINFDNLKWLLRAAPGDLVDSFDGLVIDELSKLKNPGGAQFKALRRRLGQFAWRVGLTGTPVSEDWQGLYAEMLIVDGGRSLGRSKDEYLRRYFVPLDYNGYKWALAEGAAAELSAAISESVWTMPDYRDQLPSITFKQVSLDPPAVVIETQEILRRDLLADIGGAEVTAETAATLSGKLQQVASGFAYSDEGGVAELSDFRIQAAIYLIRQIARPVVLTYWFRADRERLARALAPLQADGLRVGDMDAGAEAERAWNSGGLDVLLLHPRSAGHGLNLARGGADIIWLAPQWSRDLWEQTNARLWRRGQESPVVVWTLMARGTIDAVIAERVKEKGRAHELFLEFMSPARAAG